MLPFVEDQCTTTFSFRFFLFLYAPEPGSLSKPLLILDFKFSVFFTV